MYPTNSVDTLPAQKHDMVSVDVTPSNGHHNGLNGNRDRRRHNPYAPRASDFLNNISNFKIIESTLRGPLRLFLLFLFFFFCLDP